MRLRAFAVVAVLALTGCSSGQPTHTEKVIERVPGACGEAFEYVEEAVDEYGQAVTLTGQELIDANARARASMDRYDAAKKECLR